MKGKNLVDVYFLCKHLNYVVFLLSQATMIKQGFAAKRQLLVTASTSQKPSDVSFAHTQRPTLLQ